MAAKINSANFPPAETNPKKLCKAFAECVNIFPTILNRVRFVPNGSCMINPIRTVYPLLRKIKKENRDLFAICVLRGSA